MPQQIQLRRGTAAAWTSANPVLASGEAGVETDTSKLKFGDGTTAWASLAYVAGGGGTWGSITGTLSDQTDLQAIFDEKLDMTTATSTYQPLDGDLTAIAGLTSAADTLPYFSGAGTAATTTLTSFSRTLLDDTTPAAWRSTLKIPASDPTGITGASGIGNIISIPQEDYDAIGSPDSSIWYVIPNGYMADYGAFVIGEWVADTSATDATGLAAGEVRRNNATPASITEIYLDSITKGAVDQTTLLKLVARGQKLVLQEFDDPANFQLFTIRGAPSVASGNWTIPVALDSSGGDGATGFADGVRLIVGLGRGTPDAVFTETHAASHTLSAHECYGALYTITAAAILTLPPGADGMSLTVTTRGAVAGSVKAGASDFIRLDGVALDDADKITNSSTSGDTVVLFGSADGNWTAITDGNWTDTGA